MRAKEAKQASIQARKPASTHVQMAIPPNTPTSWYSTLFANLRVLLRSPDKAECVAFAASV